MISMIPVNIKDSSRVTTIYPSDREIRTTHQLTCKDVTAKLSETVFFCIKYSKNSGYLT
jgi:hypothetical protein